MERTIQFHHKRIMIYPQTHRPLTSSEYMSMVKVQAKGGTTTALEVPTAEEFSKFNPSLKEAIMLKMGVAECSKKDNYNKKLGRSIAKGRMDDCFFTVTMVSKTEVQLYHLASQKTIILRKHKESDRVYFEEVL